MDMIINQTIVDHEQEGFADFISDYFSYCIHADMSLKMTCQYTHTFPVLVVHMEHTQFIQDIVVTQWHQLIDMVCAILESIK